MNKLEGQRQAISTFAAKAFGIIMVVLYVSLGTTIIFRAPNQDLFAERYAVIFGLTLIMYGLYRAYKVYLLHFADRKKDQ